MYEREEKKLNEWKGRLEQIDLPVDKADRAIRQGVAKAKREQELKQRKRKRRWGLFAAAAVLFLVLVTSIRVSPAFASTVASIPGMERFVELIRYDKGLKAAFENDYYQTIGASQTEQAVTLTVDGVILDESGMNVFYTLALPEEVRTVEFGKVEIQHETELPVGSLSYGMPVSEDAGKVYEDSVELTFAESFQYEDLDFTLDMDVIVNGENRSFSIPFEVPENVKPPLVFPLDHLAEIKGQKFTINSVEIHPLRVAVNVTFDPDNSMKILNFEDMRLVDEHGEVWSSIMNGTSAFGMDSDERTYFLQSNYFEQPEKLTLEIDTLRAIDKDEASIKVDTRSKELTGGPEEGNLQLGKVTDNRIGFYYENLADGDFFDMFGQVTDAAGEEINVTEMSFHINEEGTAHWELLLETEEYQNPLSIELLAYPNFIDGDVSVPLVDLQ